MTRPEQTDASEKAAWAGADGDAEQAAEAVETMPEGLNKMSGKNVDVMVPTLGESVTEATVATWFKKAGDSVQQDEILCELETDKVSVEVPAPAAAAPASMIARRAFAATVSPSAARISSARASLVGSFGMAMVAPSPSSSIEVSDSE